MDAAIPLGVFLLVELSRCRHRRPRPIVLKPAHPFTQAGRVVGDSGAVKRRGELRHRLTKSVVARREDSPLTRAGTLVVPVVQVRDRDSSWKFVPGQLA